jgi:hypothetical protein
MQNSCINFIVYCYIFQHIYILWDFIIRVCIDFGDFPNNPLSLGFNTLCHKSFFLAFLTFQELRDSKKGKVREHGLEILRQIKWDKMGHQEVNGMHMRPGGVVSLPVHATSTRLRSVPLMSSVFAWFYLSWPKTIYLKVPLGVHERRRQRNTKNIKQRLQEVARGRSEGESVPESPPDISPP